MNSHKIFALAAMLQYMNIWTSQPAPGPYKTLANETDERIINRQKFFQVVGEQDPGPKKNHLTPSESIEYIQKLAKSLPVTSESSTSSSHLENSSNNHEVIDKAGTIQALAKIIIDNSNRALMIIQLGDFSITEYAQQYQTLINRFEHTESPEDLLICFKEGLVITNEQCGIELTQENQELLMTTLSKALKHTHNNCTYKLDLTCPQSTASPKTPRLSWIRKKFNKIDPEA